VWGIVTSITCIKACVIAIDEVASCDVSGVRVLNGWKFVQVCEIVARQHEARSFVRSVLGGSAEASSSEAQLEKGAGLFG